MIMTNPINKQEIAIYPVFYCKRRGSDAKGFLLDDGSFLIMKGSKIANGNTPSYTQRTKGRMKTLPLKGNVLQKDIIMSSPSAASNIVSGAVSNGWDEWVDFSGATLGSYRKNNL